MLSNGLIISVEYIQLCTAFCAERRQLCKERWIGESPWTSAWHRRNTE